MNAFKKTVLAILLFALIFGMYSCVVTNDTNNITAWATARGETVKDIDPRQFNIGPYWYVKGARYYRVETDKHVYWFRYLYGRTIKYDDGDEVD